MPSRGFGKEGAVDRFPEEATVHSGDSVLDTNLRYALLEYAVFLQKVGAQHLEHCPKVLETGVRR